MRGGVREAFDDQKTIAECKERLNWFAQIRGLLEAGQRHLGVLALGWRAWDRHLPRGRDMPVGLDIKDDA